MFQELQLILILSFTVIVINIFNNLSLRIIISLILSSFLSLQIISYYIQGELIDYRFFIHSDLSTIKVYAFQFKKEIIYLIILFILTNTLLVKFNIKKIKIYKKSYISLSIIFLLGLSLPSKSVLNKIYQINKIYSKQNLYEASQLDINQSNYEKFINDNNFKKYFETDNLEAKIGYNIIYISLESFDDGFIFGTPELTPNLNKLIKEWNFKKIKNIDGCSWSVGSLYCLMTGLPSYFPFEKNKIFHGTNKINIINLGNIFKKSNYEKQLYIVGESNLVGTKNLLESMNFEIFDSSKSQNEYQVYPDTFGFHDKDLFYELKKKIKLFKKEEKSFVIFGATINTHLNGIIDDRMNDIIGNNFDNNIEHAVKALDYHIGNFVKFLKDEKLLENTAIFIGPDHFFPKNKSLNKVNKKIDYPERSLFIISNKDIQTDSQIAIAKTILDAAKIETNHKYFFEKKEYNEMNNFINDNIVNFSQLNNSIISYKKSPEEINLNIDGNILKLNDGGNILYELNLKNDDPSFINLVFDKNFIFKNDEFPKETLIPRKIRKEDEKYEYYFLTIFKKNNTIVNSHLTNTKNKSIFKLITTKNSITINTNKFLEQNNIKEYASNTDRFIAHAGGGLKNIKYLNTIEALNNSYSKGFKLFELDLQLTADNFIVAVHDWDEWKIRAEYKGKLPPKLNDFNNYKIFKNQTPIDYKKINKWFGENLDAKLITDKIQNYEILSNQIKIDKNRIFVEVFNENDLLQFKNNGFNIIANIDFLNELNDPISFLNDNNIKKISASHKIIKQTNNNIFNIIKQLFKKNLVKKLIENNFEIYAYNLNESRNLMTEKKIICNYRNIFYGIYSDYWSFYDNDINC